MSQTNEYKKVFTTDMFDLLIIFNSHQVQYLIVGAHAVNAYTEARMTKDLDVWVNPSNENALKTYAALKEFGAPIANATIQDFTDEDSFFIIGVKPNRIDILKKIPGVIFDEAWKRKNIVSINEHKLNVLSFDDTLKAKIAAGRPQDLLDVEKLKKARNLKK